MPDHAAPQDAIQPAETARYALGAEAGSHPGSLAGALGAAVPLRHLIRMLTAKAPRLTSSADLNAAIDRVAPDVLALLANGVPRDEAAIVAALAGRHPKQDVRLTLMRLHVLGQLELQGSRYIRPAAEAEQG